LTLEPGMPLILSTTSRIGRFLTLISSTDKIMSPARIWSIHDTPQQEQQHTGTQTHHRPKTRKGHVRPTAGESSINNLERRPWAQHRAPPRWRGAEHHHAPLCCPLAGVPQRSLAGRELASTYSWTSPSQRAGRAGSTVACAPVNNASRSGSMRGRGRPC
jgi:hypothetical protein